VAPTASASFSGIGVLLKDAMDLRRAALSIDGECVEAFGRQAGNQLGHEIELRSGVVGGRLVLWQHAGDQVR
jgi:hypothetical protein